MAPLMFPGIILVKKTMSNFSNIKIVPFLMYICVDIYVYLFSFFGFIILHMMMYSANIYFWRRYRINYTFMFGFKQGTELGHREVFFLSTGLTVLTLACVLSHLDMEVDPETKRFEALVESIPLALLTVSSIIHYVVHVSNISLFML